MLTTRRLSPPLVVDRRLSEGPNGAGRDGARSHGNIAGQTSAASAKPKQGHHQIDTATVPTQFAQWDKRQEKIRIEMAKKKY